MNIEPGVVVIKLSEHGPIWEATWWHTKFHLESTAENLEKPLLLADLRRRDPGLTHYRDINGTLKKL